MIYRVTIKGIRNVSVSPAMVIIINRHAKKVNVKMMLMMLIICQCYSFRSLVSWLLSRFQVLHISVLMRNLWRQYVKQDIYNQHRYKHRYDIPASMQAQVWYGIHLQRPIQAQICYTQPTLIQNYRHDILSQHRYHYLWKRL